MNTTTMQSLMAKVMILAASAAVLAGFAAVTQRAEQRAERALEAAVATSGKRYAAPAPTVQLATVVITTKRAS